MLTGSKSIFSIFIILFFTFPLFAQEQAMSESKEQTENEAVFVEGNIENQWQYLEWVPEKSGYALFYEVILEEKNPKTGKWEKINKLRTQSNETKIQAKREDGSLLLPGTYRYMVITYSLIGFEAGKSDWFEFIVYKAYQPEVKNVVVSVNLTSTIYLDEKNDGIFTVIGKNLFEVKGNDNELSFTEYALYSSRRSGVKLLPEILEQDKNANKMKVKFNMKDLHIGDWYFIARDASGLSNPYDHASLLKVRFKKPVDIDLSGGYSLPVFIFDESLKEAFNTNIFPLSFYAKLNVMPLKYRQGYFGIGINAFYTRMFINEDVYSLDGNFTAFHANLVYQVPLFDRKAILELHSGAGLNGFLNYVFHFENNINSATLNSINMSFDVGILAQIYITKRLFAETGADFIFSLIPDDMTIGIVVPTVGIGWRF